MRTEHGAAASPLRCADGALTSAAGALLAPRLLAAAADVAAVFGVVRAEAAVRQMGDYNLVHRGHMNRGTEDGIRKRYFPDNLALEINFFYYRHRLQPPT